MERYCQALHQSELQMKSQDHITPSYCGPHFDRKLLAAQNLHCSGWGMQMVLECAAANTKEDSHLN